MARSEPLKYFIILTGNTKNAEEDFVRKLHKRGPRMQKVSTVAECDVILCFCPVVSRAGTDIEAALNKLDNESGNKPVVLVVLIHTLNPEDIVPDSSKSVNRENTLTVDCLFHEDQQLWKCNTNYDAIDKVTEYLKPKVKKENRWSLKWFRVVKFRKQVTRRGHDNNDDDDLISDSAERTLLPKNTSRNAEEEDSNNSFCRRWCCCCFGAVC